MKTLYLLGGPMGVGKATVGKALANVHENSIYIEGDMANDAMSFSLDEEEKKKVLKLIIDMLNKVLNDGYEHVILGWEMDQQSTINAIMQGTKNNCNRINQFSLIASPKILRKRLQNDIKKGIRKDDGVIARSLEKLPLYKHLTTVKIDTSNIDLHQIIELILEDGCNCMKHRHD